MGVAAARNRERPTPMRVVRTAADSRPIAERGTMMYAKDVQRLLGTRPNGRPLRSITWIHEHFAPESRRYIGRTPFWWEIDVAAALSRTEPTR
jgi:hypothetical protein